MFHNLYHETGNANAIYFHEHFIDHNMSVLVWVEDRGKPALIGGKFKKPRYLPASSIKKLRSFRRKRKLRTMWECTEENILLFDINFDTNKEEKSETT